MRTTVDKVIQRIRQVVDGFLVVIFMVMLAAVLLQVGVRALTSYSLVGTEEAANFSQLWMVLVGAGVALRFGRHVAVDIVINMFSEKVRFYVSVLNSIAMLWFLYIVFTGSLPLVDMGMFEHSSALGMPMWIMYSSLMVGSAYIALELILSVHLAYVRQKTPENSN